MKRYLTPIVAVILLIITILIGLVTNLLTAEPPVWLQSVTSPDILAPTLAVLVALAVILVMLQSRTETNHQLRDPSAFPASGFTATTKMSYQISRTYDVFVSHSPDSQQWVESVLLPQFEASDIRAFVPYRDAAIGVSKVQDIEQAIQNSRHTLLVITPEYLKDSWASLENMIAQFIDPSSRERRLIPLVKEPCELPLNLRAINFLDLTSGEISDSSWQKLIEALQPVTFIQSVTSERDKAKAVSSNLHLNTTLEDAVNEVRELVLATKYTEAQVQAEQYYDSVVQDGNPVLLGKLEVWYAHAIMYLGKTNEAKSVLGSLISRCQALHLGGTQMATVRYILGRAHNNLGYIFWVDLGQYKNALGEFYQAIRYFLLCDQTDDIATVCDNIGRVYAQLGYGTHAELYIEHGKTLRQNTGDPYRLALSLDSLANAYLASGQANRAWNKSQQALQMFTKYQKENQKGERGIGLALLTKGRAERLLGSLGYTGDDRPRDYAINLKQLANAEKTLLEAKKLFEKVNEKIRLFQVQNELACVYREYLDINKRLGKGEEKFEQLARVKASIKESLRYIEHDDVSGDIKYRLHYVDTCEDMARTLNIVNLPMEDNEQIDDENWIEKAIEKVPSEYRFVETTSSEKPESAAENLIDEFWQQMGKIYALQGETTFEKDKYKAVEFYILATACFGRFREQEPTLSLDETRFDNIHLYPTYTPQLASHRVFVSKLYDDLKMLSSKELQTVHDTLIPKIVKAYSLQNNWLHDFREVLQLLLSVKVAPRVEVG